MVTETKFSEVSFLNKGYDIFPTDSGNHGGSVASYTNLHSCQNMPKITNTKFNDHQVEQVWCTFIKGSEWFLVRLQLLVSSRSIDALATSNNDNVRYGLFINEYGSVWK